MLIEQKREGEVLILTIKDRLDTTTAPELEKELTSEAAGAPNVVLDFKEVEYMSSAGLRALLTGQKTLKANNQSLTLVNVSEEIKEIIKMTGFDKILTINP
jgi:anti-anti-sigma factor